MQCFVNIELSSVYSNYTCVSLKLFCMQIAVFILTELPKLLIIVGVILWYLYRIGKGCVSALRQQGLVSTLCL